MRYSPLKMRLLARFPRFVCVAALAAGISIGPLHGTAQAPSPAQGSPSANSASPSTGSAAAQTPTSEEDQERAFLHSPIVQSVARVLHLSLDTTVDILLGINFAIIFLLIAIPLSRTMPRIFRRRSQTLRHNLDTARKATAEARTRLSAVEAKLAGLDEEIQKLRAQVEQESREDEKRITTALGEESARIVASAEQEIGMAAAQAKRGLRNFAADLAIEQAAKQMALTPETDRALIAEFIAGVAADDKGKGGQN